MKNMYLISVLFMAAYAADSTAQSLPRTEFSLQVSSNQIELQPGGTAQITVNLLRSKSFTKYKGHLGFSSALPEGVTVNFEPNEGLFDSSVATIKVAESMKPGQYQFIMNCEMGHKIKGSIVKLVVTRSTEVVTIN